MIVPTKNSPGLWRWVGILLLSVSFPSIAEIAWPGWLGPARDGWVDDFEAPAPWPKQLDRDWTVEVGSGYGTPLVWKSRVYQHARQGEEEVVLCLDRATGKTIWKNSQPVSFEIGGGGERHGKGPKSNPYFVHGKVFTYSITGTLTAWDAQTGNLLWHKDHRSQFDKPYPYWGASASPVADEKRVFVHFGGDEQGFLAAMEIESGRELWRQGRSGASYSSPLVVTLYETPQVIDWDHESISGVEIDSGRVLWDYPLPHRGTNQNMPTPSIYEGLVLVGGENRGLYGLTPKLEEGIWRVEERWHQRRVALDMSTAIVQDGALYGFSHLGLGRLFCVSIHDGSILWQGPGRAGQNATFLNIKEQVIVLMDDGRLKIIAASKDRLHVLREYVVSERSTWAAPVLLEEGFLIKDASHLTLWKF